MFAQCPTCAALIPEAQTNPQADLVVCDACSEAFRLSQLRFLAGDEDRARLPDAPAGAWYGPVPGGFEVGGTTRSGLWVLLIPFLCLWSGIPTWFLIIKPLLERTLEWAQLGVLPFFLGGIALGWLAALSIAGACVARVRGDELEIFTGIGRLGWRRRYRWSDVRRVLDGLPRSNFPGQQSTGIRVECSATFQFGSMMPPAVRDFVRDALCAQLGSTLHAAGGTKT